MPIMKFLGQVTSYLILFFRNYYTVSTLPIRCSEHPLNSLEERCQIIEVFNVFIIQLPSFFIDIGKASSHFTVKSVFWKLTFGGEFMDEW